MVHSKIIFHLLQDGCNPPSVGVEPRRSLVGLRANLIALRAELGTSRDPRDHINMRIPIWYIIYDIEHMEYSMVLLKYMVYNVTRILQTMVSGIHPVLGHLGP